MSEMIKDLRDSDQIMKLLLQLLNESRITKEEYEILVDAVERRCEAYSMA